MNCLTNGSLEMTYSDLKSDCDFDYYKCTSLNCSYFPDCWNKYQMIKRNNEFKRLIGNYELFD